MVITSTTQKNSESSLFLHGTCCLVKDLRSRSNFLLRPCSRRNSWDVFFPWRIPGEKRFWIMNHELFIPEKSRILYQNGSTRGIFWVGKLDKIKVSPEKIVNSWQNALSSSICVSWKANMYQLLSTPNRQTLVDYLGFPTPAGPLSPDPSFAAGAPTSPCDPTSLGRLGPKSLELSLRANK